jgi:hypothetical protein
VRRPRHPNAKIEAALRHAEKHGWRIEVGGSHCWGRLYCPHNDSNCRKGDYCMNSIWSTPSRPESYARRLRKAVDGCTGGRATEGVPKS